MPLTINKKMILRSIFENIPESQEFCVGFVTNLQKKKELMIFPQLIIVPCLKEIKSCNTFEIFGKFSLKPKKQKTFTHWLRKNTDISYFDIFGEKCIQGW